MTEHPGALALLARIAAEMFEPQEPLPFDVWLERNLVLIDGPDAGELWNAAGAPYLIEPAQVLDPEHPATLVTIRKSQQTGASILGLGWCLYLAERAPANMLYVVPGIDALRDLNNGKLRPLIEAWHKRRGSPVILPQTSRSGEGSTTYEKVFPGGYLNLGNANSAMDLSSKTVRFGVKDELSKWEDIPGFGNPENLFLGRFTAFRGSATYKILEISTPEIDSGDELGDLPGHCRIDRSFRRSDQRFWHIACPECGGLFVMRQQLFQIDEKRPGASTMRCEHCGHGLSEIERRQAIRGANPRLGAEAKGGWIATKTEPDRHPGFHIDGFMSLMLSLGSMAEDWLRLRHSESNRKDYSNLNLGLPYRYRGDAPDHKRLLERREDLRRGHVPPRGLLLVMGVDVQKRGLWYEVEAFARDGQTWVVDAGYLDGETDAHDGAAYAHLAALINRDWPDAFGGQRRLDAVGIDSGFNTHAVYRFVRGAQRMHPMTGRDVLLAVKGLEGWGRPPIGTPELVDVDMDGRKLKQGVKVWGVGTWPIKMNLYGQYRLEGIKAGKPEDPPGYPHFPEWLDENYFRQITAEHLEEPERTSRRARSRWVASGENHLLDCRVYCRAMAEYLGLSHMGPAEWAHLERQRGAPAAATEDTLFTQPPAQAPPAVAAPRLAEADDWLDDHRTANW